MGRIESGGEGVGGWRLEVGGWRLEVGGWGLPARMTPVGRGSWKNIYSWIFLHSTVLSLCKSPYKF